MANDREDRLEQSVHDSYLRTPPAAADLHTRILRGLDSHDSAVRRSALWTWWWRPAPLRLAPAVVLVAACLLVGVGSWITSAGWRAWQAPHRDPGATYPPNSPAHVANVPGVWQSGAAGRVPGREVAFMLVAPGVTRVALVGEFNDWDPLATPLVRVGRDGPWVTTVPLQPGRHVYGFVLDGWRWMPDPGAPLAPDDGFGTPNSVVVVGQEGPL